MLARPTTIEKMTRTLRLPEIPTEVEQAETELADARQRASAAAADLNVKTAKLSPSTNADDRRRLQAAISAANELLDRCRTDQGAAANRRNEAKRSFGAQVDQILAAEVKEYERAVGERFDELAELLAVGQRLADEANAAGITLGSTSIIGAVRLIGMLKPLRATFAAWTC